MPTQILYEVIGVFDRGYSSHREPAWSFFGAYNPFAIEGSLMALHKPNLRGCDRSDLLKGIFLSRPYEWAGYVVDGIVKNKKNGKEALRAVCKFLYDAGFYGFFLENTRYTNNLYTILENIAAGRGYHSAEGVLREQYPTMPPKVMSAVLSDGKIMPYITSLRVRYNPKDGSFQERRFVERRNKYRFQRAVGRVVSDKGALVHSDIGTRIAVMIQTQPLTNDMTGLLVTLGRDVAAYRRMVKEGSNGFSPLEAWAILEMARQREEEEGSNFISRNIRKNLQPLEELLA